MVRLRNASRVDEPKTIRHRVTRAVDGDGQCAVHIRVDALQNLSNNWRRVRPAWAESRSAIIAASSRARGFPASPNELASYFLSYKGATRIESGAQPQATE